jgi:predicted HTH transcriptional regulator
MTTPDIVTSIDQRLTQAKAEITQLEGARLALISGAAPTAEAKPRTRRRRTLPGRQEAVPAGKITALLHDSTGMSTAELAQATNGNSAQILRLLRELEKTDHVRRTGERRGTRWHLITEEDRIATRAAEIAAQSKRRRAKTGA